jgi:hypothetical protein
MMRPPRAPRRSDWPWTLPAGPGSTARTYELTHDTLTRLVTLAKQLGCYPSNLVEALLVNGLDAIECGGLVVDKRPIMFEIAVKRPQGPP